MALGRLAVAAATSVACFFAGGEASATGRLLAPAGSENGVSQVRMAMALAPRQSTAWWSLDLQGPKRPVVLVVPAARGTAIDPASSRWFQALERVTAPKIVLSRDAPLCGGPFGSRVHDTSDGPRAATIEISELAVLSSLGEVAAFAAARGVEFAPADRESLLAYSVANQFVAFAYDVPELGGTTETLRMTWRGTETGLSLQLALSRAKVPVTLWTIAGGRAALPPAREYEPRELAPVWKVADGRSDYPERRHAWLGSRSETSWLIEATGDDFLYDWRVLPESSGAIQPVIGSYFAEDPGGACTAKVLQVRTASGRVAPACAKGELGWVETSDSRIPCVESVAAGEIDPDSLRCGALDDFALALSDQEIDQTWVTRHRGVLFSTQPQSVQIRSAGSGRVSPIVFTSSVDVGRCGSTGGASGVGGGFGAGGASNGAMGGISGAAGTGSATGGWGGVGSRHPDPHYPPGVHDETNVEVGCASSGGDADCGGDTSSGGGDESCSGDSSSEDSEGCGSDSSDDEGGDDCGGDSSGDEGDDCGGDSSSEGGDDCGGDSSSEGGDDCSGDSSGGGDDCSGDSGGDCSGETAGVSPAVQNATAALASPPRPRRFRPRVSAVTLVLCAFALFVRRSSRREHNAVVPR